MTGHDKSGHHVTGLRIRQGGPDDAELVLALIDAAVVWMNARGNTTQWGTQPWSTRPVAVDRVREQSAGGGLWCAEIDGKGVGALVVSDRAPADIPQVDEPELFVNLLVTSRRHTGQGIGGALLDHARVLARRRGVALVRVDCWAGGGGELVNYYRRAGFTPTETFAHGQWPGQVLEDRLSAQ